MAVAMTEDQDVAVEDVVDVDIKGQATISIYISTPVSARETKLAGALEVKAGFALGFV